LFDQHEDFHISPIDEDAMHLLFEKRVI
jgi:hypothetical protein